MRSGSRLGQRRVAAIVDALSSRLGDNEMLLAIVRPLAIKPWADALVMTDRRMVGLAGRSKTLSLSIDRSSIIGWRLSDNITADIQMDLRDGTTMRIDLYRKDAAILDEVLASPIGGSEQGQRSLASHGPLHVWSDRLVFRGVEYRLDAATKAEVSADADVGGSDHYGIVADYTATLVVAHPDYAFSLSAKHAHADEIEGLRVLAARINALANS